MHSICRAPARMPASELATARPEIVVAVGRDDDLVHARHARPEHRDEIEIFLRQRVADGIRNIDRRGAGLDRRFADPAEIIVLGACRIHRAPLDIVGVAARPRHRRNDALVDLILRQLQLMLAVKRRRSDECVDAAALGWLDRLAGPVDVVEVRTREPADDRLLGELGDLGHRLEIAFRRDRKSSFDNVDAHRVEKLGDLQLLLECHRGAGALLAVAQSCIENYDLVVVALRHCRRVFSWGRHRFSSSAGRPSGLPRIASEAQSGGRPIPWARTRRTAGRHAAQGPLRRSSESRSSGATEPWRSLLRGAENAAMSVAHAMKAYNPKIPAKGPVRAE